MNITIDAVAGLYLAATISLLILAIVAYPTLRERAKKGR